MKHEGTRRGRETNRRATSQAWGWLLCLPLILRLVSPAGAAEAQGAYRVQPGDTVEVHVWNDGDESREFVVDAQGNASCPGVGVVSVKGMTLAEITDRLVSELKKVYKTPRVTVSVKALAQSAPPVATARRVYVLGAVSRPGSYELTPGMRVMDALAQAGGPTPNAVLGRATLTGTTRGRLPVDLEKLLVGGQIGQNIPLDPDDVLLIPTLDEKSAGPAVVVVGQVVRPGSHRLPPGSRLSDAMSACGGAGAAADLRRATLTRAGLAVTVDLDALFRKGEMAGDLPLQEGDILLVPERLRKQICLLGNFQKPGVYEFQEGGTLLDAVALAGGPSEEGDLQGAVLKRGGKENTVDLCALLKRGEMQWNQALQDGDVLVLPAGMRVYAVGAVSKPGPMAVARDAKLIDVLFQAGGAAPRARLDKAGVVRVVDGKPQVLPLNIKDATEKGGRDRDFQFMAGDILFIPTKPQALTWQGVVGTATSITGALWLLGLNDRR